MQKKTVHKLVSGKTQEDFNAVVNEHIRAGWLKAEATFFSETAYHASMSAEVNRILLPIPTELKEAILASAANHYQQNLSELLVQLQTRESAVPRVLEAGTLVKHVDVADRSRFIHDNGMVIDLAMIERPDGARELVVIRAVEDGCRDKGKFDSFSAYQI